VTVDIITTDFFTFYQTYCVYLFVEVLDKN